MSSKKVFFAELGRTGNALGKGIIAGLAGTVAITISQMIEMQITKRGNSNAPMKVAKKVLGVEPEGKAELEVAEKDPESERNEEELKQSVQDNTEQFSQFLHFLYGTSWGMARGVLDIAGIKGAPASVAHFGAIWGAAQLMLPAANAAEPITKWSPKQIAVDVGHHAAYACVAGAVYDAMNRHRKKGKKKNIINYFFN
jgi:hypothetical protein